MSLRSSVASLLAILSGCALACRLAPRGLELGSVALDLLGADGTVVLHSLEHGGCEQIAVEAGKIRLAQVPAGVYRLELVSDARSERGSDLSGGGRSLIEVASGRITALRLTPHAAPAVAPPVSWQTAQCCAA